MARGRSFTSLINQIARDQARAERQAESARRKEQRDRERARKEEQRRRMLSEKESKQQYIEDRLDDVEEKNQELEEFVTELETILEQALDLDNTIDFDSLRLSDKFDNLFIPSGIGNPQPPPYRAKYLLNIEKPKSFAALLPGAKRKYQESLQKAEEEFQKALSTHAEKEVEREKTLQRMLQEHEQKKQAFLENVNRHNKEIDEFEAAYRNGDPEGIIAYNTMVLEKSDYPEAFPHEFRIAYVPEPKELVIEYELPLKTIIPKVAEYSYSKTKDQIEAKQRKDAEINQLYQDIIASICLRTIHEILEADQCGHVEIIVFNGFVQTVNCATGKDERRCLISIRTSQKAFMDLDLSRVDMKACLRNLGAQVSPRPGEMQAVKPIVEFDMVDKRYVEQSDILSDLESRPNLMDLNPFEFENLVSNLFDRMGLEAKQTRSSKDGGVDCVAFDHRPILGGKVIIQAKRYKNIVGVNAVRDLYGTMVNEGANKGILVTTSHYGPDAYDFAKNKPIELVDGGGLLYLLDQVGIQARIIFPED